MEGQLPFARVAMMGRFCAAPNMGRQWGPTPEMRVETRKEGTGMFEFFWVFQLLQLCCFCGCPCDSLTSSQAYLLLAAYAFPLFLLLFLWWDS